MDVPENDKKIYHKTMRFQKVFLRYKNISL